MDESNHRPLWIDAKRIRITKYTTALSDPKNCCMTNKFTLIRFHLLIDASVGFLTPN